MAVRVTGCGFKVERGGTTPVDITGFETFNVGAALAASPQGGRSVVFRDEFMPAVTVPMCLPHGNGMDISDVRPPM